MRIIFSTIFLLTAFLCCGARHAPQEPPVKLIFTANFQSRLFVRDPLTGYYSKESMPYAATYIRSHRNETSDSLFALVNCGENLPAAFRLAPFDPVEQVKSYMRYDTTDRIMRGDLSFGFIRLTDDAESNRKAIDIFRSQEMPDVCVGLFTSPHTDPRLIALTDGIDLAVAAYGDNASVFRVVNIKGDTLTVLNTGTTGSFIGVAEVSSKTDVSVRIVDITGFFPDKEYETFFAPLADSLSAYYRQSLTVIDKTLYSRDALFGPSGYASLFHRFQLETTGADISFFAPPSPDDSLAAEITFGDVLRRFRFDNDLCVISLTGREIRDYLEYACGLWFNTMRSIDDDLLRMSRSGGELRLLYGCSYFDSAEGIRYTVNVTRPRGGKVTILSMADGTPFDPERRYRVAMNSFRAGGGGKHLPVGCGISPQELSARLVRSFGDYRSLLRDWLAKQPCITPHVEPNWRIVPENWRDAAEIRGFTDPTR